MIVTALTFAMGIVSLAIAGAVFLHVRRSGMRLAEAGPMLLAFFVITGLVDISMSISGSMSLMTAVLDAAALGVLVTLLVRARRLADVISELEAEVATARSEAESARYQVHAVVDARELAMRDRLAGEMW